MDDGDLVLTVGGQDISGWTSIRVTRGIERCPSDFDISMTEKYPGQDNEVVVQPGDACTVTIGGDTVVTGYVDRYVPSIQPNGHAIRVIGRGKCQDLVDCSAEWPNGQISGSTVLGIAQKLAKPYGITVATDVDTGAVIPQFQLLRGETPFEIIERICRYRGLLAFEKPDGSLFLTTAGSQKAASGVTQGQNVQIAEASYSIDGRYSAIVAFLQSMDTLADTSDNGKTEFSAADPAIKRHRQLDIIADAATGGWAVCQKRAIWEVARRQGRGNVLSVTVDSWRDGDGDLWEPNTIIPVSLPVLKVPQMDWTVGAVTYVLDERGTVAELTIMPKSAFVPEPLGPPQGLLEPRS
ncbi:MAG TPA: hypothetical protein VGH23_16165 [Rhizomicrobium sp.]|jgi:prophage tail gpP-like protein